MSDEICVKYPVQDRVDSGYIRNWVKPAVEGSITVDANKFPLELLQELMNVGGHRLMLQIEIPTVWISGGMSISHDENGTTVELDFSAHDITISPAK